jgi:hypothetical protein
MRAINRKYLKLLAINITNPTRNVCGFSVRGIYDRVAIRRKPRLANGKAVKRAEGHPRVVACIASAANRRENVAQDRSAESRAHGNIEKQTKFG